MVGVIKGDHGGVRIRGVVVVVVAMFPPQAEVLQLLVEGDDGGQQQGLHHAPHHQHVKQLTRGHALELESNLRKVSQCQKKAPTIDLKLGRLFTKII